MTDKFMVFDVESIGLHGDGFAVAWVVVNREGERLGEGCMACPRDLCTGTAESRLWVDENVPALDVTSPTPHHLRNTFWHEWRHWADQGAVLVADCAWPVEANFLSACVKLNHAEREWQGPYPLHDLASVILALGGNALALTERLPDELPAHHPLMDARQSARQLVACLKAPNESKPARIRVNGVLVPAPESKPPQGHYFVADPVAYDCAVGPFEWTGDATDHRMLAAKLVYLTAENAQARGQAMLHFELVGADLSQLQEATE